MDALPANYLCSRDRDRMRTKGISLGVRTPSDRNTSFLIARRNRFRVDGVSLENVYHSYTGILSLLLSVPAVPTVTSSTSKIEETPIAIEADDLDTLEVPAVPTVTSLSTSKIEETPVIIEGAFEVPAVPTVSISTSIYEPS